jgi:uncharacterized damage-inducible protein DinB
MGKLDLIRALYDYNEYANNYVLDVAKGLSAEEFSRDRGASFGSIEANLAHMNAGQTVWRSRWVDARNPSPLAELQSICGYDTIRAAFDESHARLREFVSGLTEERLDQPLHYLDSSGSPHRRPLWQLMLHLANHGTHHRAEICMALTMDGHTVKELDYHYFELEREGRR